MKDITQRLRDKAADLYDTDGEAMKLWDRIRHQMETMKGSEIPRMNFEGFIEEIADLLVEAADEIEYA